MLTPPQIRHRLRGAAAAAFRGDRAALAEAASWLGEVSARELLRFDDHARRYRYEGPVLGEAGAWTAAVLAQAPAAAALASMHRDGYVRQRAVQALAATPGPLSDRALAVRVTDHIEAIRAVAAREVLRRTALAQAGRIAPLLHRIRQRGRGNDLFARYVAALAADHGEAAAWARLRDSGDPAVRRTAFRHGLDSGLLGPEDALALFPRERDQVVRRMLVGVIADTAPPATIARVLLRGRSAEGRALGLVKLTAAEIDPADLERLLVDRSVLVRLWARRRWRETGRDPAEVYAAVARSTAKPAVRAAAYTGLVETGTAVGHREIMELVRSQEPPLRKTGLALLRGAATAEDVPLLFGLVAGDHSRVARLASEVLVRSPRLWTRADLASLEASDRPELRRRAWWIHRRLGGWEAVIADLAMLGDPDPSLAMLGRRPAPPMYGPPTGDQRERIAARLANAPLPRAQRVAIAVAAGLPELARAINRSR